MLLVDGFARNLLDKRPSGQRRLIRLASFLLWRLALVARLIVNAE
jgi:hypothetical protein